MSKLFLFLVVTRLALARADMIGGMKLKSKIDYLVYLYTSQTDYLYEFNYTTEYPPTKWLFCMGILYDSLTVLTAEPCNVGTSGMYWAAGANAMMGQFHPIKSIVRGRHRMDFRVVEASNSTDETWGSLGDTDPMLMMSVNLSQLYKMANNNTMGIVTSFASPTKVGAMMMINLNECADKYYRLLNSTSSVSLILPISFPVPAFCAVRAKEDFDPGAIVTDFSRLAPNLMPGTGPVPPGVACPDSLGSPFIISGGQVLGILIAADCATENVSFFQSLVESVPTINSTVSNYTQGTYWPTATTKNETKLTPRPPMVRGVSLKLAAWQVAATPSPSAGARHSAWATFLLTNVFWTICK